MAEEREELETEAQQETKEKPKILKILGFSLLALVLVFLTIAISFLVASKVLGKKYEPEKQRFGAYQVQPPGEVFKFRDPFMVNYADVEGQIVHNVVLHVALEYDPKRYKNLGIELSQREEQLRDIILSILYDKSFEEVTSKNRLEDLKEEIKDKINRVLIQGKIRNVYITSMNFS